MSYYLELFFYCCSFFFRTKCKYLLANPKMSITNLKREKYQLLGVKLWWALRCFKSVNRNAIIIDSQFWHWTNDLLYSSLEKSTVFVRISDMARISASFGLFYVLRCYFEMRHYFNDVKVPKNAQDQCEFEYLFIF